MIAFESLKAQIDTLDSAAGDVEMAAGLVEAAEHVIENWLEAHDQAPTDKTHEGSRLIALHRQGAKGDPSFNACRETCRELVYRYNVIIGGHAGDETEKVLEMMRLLARHIFLFISGKLQESKLGEFCCSSKSLRLESALPD